MRQRRTVKKTENEQIVPVYVGLDYHDETIRVCVMDDTGRELVNRNVANNVGTVVDLVRSHGGLVREASLEACCGAADFATKLAEATQWRVRMAHPGAVRRLKAGANKTDCEDASHLADLSRVGYLPEVWLADESTRQLRRLVRHRQGAVDHKKRIKLRIRALLREERTVAPQSLNAWTKGWMAWLKTVKLGEQTRWVLDQELMHLDHMVCAIAAVEAQMDQATKDDPVVAKLKEKPGIGVVTAVVMRAAIGRFDRFRSGKQLSCYCGVTPRNASSGKRQADAGLIESGNDILRPLLLQLAKRLPRIDAHWREFHRNLILRKPANVISAAIANRWLRRLYHEMVAPPVVAA